MVQPHHNDPRIAAAAYGNGWDRALERAASSPRPPLAALGCKPSRMEDCHALGIVGQETEPNLAAELLCTVDKQSRAEVQR